MFRHLQTLWTDDSGFIVSAELVLISTICVLGLIVGLGSVQSAIVCEFNDISRAFVSLNQSFSIPGFAGCKGKFFAGSAFINTFNNANCGIMTTNSGTVMGSTGLGMVGPAFGGASLGIGPVGVGGYGGGYGGGIGYRRGAGPVRPAVVIPPVTPVCPDGNCPDVCAPLPGTALPPMPGSPTPATMAPVNPPAAGPTPAP